MSTKDLAQALTENPDPSGSLRIGVITAIGTDPARRVKTDQTGTAWLNRDQDIALALDDRVWMIKQGATFLVCGRLSGVLSQPVVRRKTSNETRASTTTSADDNSLAYPLVAGNLYRIQLFVAYSASSVTPDIRSKWAFSGSTGSNRSCFGPGAATTATEGQSAGSVMRASVQGFATDTLYGTDAGLGTGAIYEDLLLTPTISGVLQWQWAQGTSDAAGVTVTTASRMYITPVTAV